MSWPLGGRSLKILGSLALAAVACAVAGGCEALISDTVPAFTCSGTEPSSCPASQICAPSLGHCIDRGLSCTVLQNCGAGKRCDPGTQSCVDDGTGGDASPPKDSGLPDTTPPPDTGGVDASDAGFDAPDTNTCRGIGCPCVRGADCDSNMCPPASVLAGVSAQACTRPCCSSADCGRDNVCFAAGTGGNYCVPKAVLGRNVTLGSAKGGTACSQGSDCQSGLCTNNRCLDACCVDANCAAGTQCALNSDTAHSVLQCVVNTPGNVGMDQTCSTNADCHGGFCYDYGGGTKACVIPCCGSTSTACGSYLGVPNICADVFVDPQKKCPPSTNCDVIPGCASPPTGDQGGNGNLGDICTANNKCKSAHCIGGKCSDVCCSDADCNAVSGWICQPTAGTSGVFLRCGPPM